jgi:hypothetical protein
MRQLRHYFPGFWHISLLLFLLSSGCAKQEEAAVTEVPTNLTPELEQALIKRVEGKWRAMEAWDYAAAYEYTTPNYREVFSKSMFLNKFGYDIRWVLTDVDVLHYDADAAVASVAVRVMSESTKQTTLASNIGAVPVTVNEKWFFINGEWWSNAK